MHGRPRNAPKPDEAVSAAKAANLRSLQTQFIHNHQLHMPVPLPPPFSSHLAFFFPYPTLVAPGFSDKVYFFFFVCSRYDENALAICTKLLEINPEMYTAWNYRKLAVNSLLGSLTEEESVKPVLDEELRVVESALKRNPKCYGAWHHRKWVLEKRRSLIDVGREFKLLDMLLTLDGRNFNGWNYRRFVAELKNISVEEELKFTTNKIDSNFSNYSAWHNRSILLSCMLMNKAEGIASREKVLVEELDLVHQAIFTDPDDQSGWFYHLWLLKETVRQNTPVILSSWPRHGSIINLCSTVASDGIPIVLYFSQPVGGVSSSTVNIECVSAESQHRLWSPLSIDKSGKARAWCAHFKIENVHDLPKDYVVKVCVGSGQGIISSSGAYSKNHHVFDFTVNLQSNNLEEGVKNFSTEIYSWATEKLSCSDHFIQELHSVIDVDKLKITEDCKNSISQFCEEILKNEILLFRELLTASECKIGMLTLARLLMVHNDMLSHGFLSSHEKTDCKEILKIFDIMMKVDPKHHLYYKDMQSLVLLEQITSNALMEHHYCEEGPDNPVKSHCKASLCLDNLSISRFGFVERLLWVQVLDLSHNELQTVEGFEAMQLLKCLNLSYNKFRSFTAVEPLRLIRSLSVLDISFNEIGSHSIDTSRYLCSSPLPRSTDASWTLETCGTACVELEHCWEAAVTFKDMNLVQLNVAGNTISEEKFKKFLQRILPSLKWLDGMEMQ